MPSQIGTLAPSDISCFLCVWPLTVKRVLASPTLLEAGNLSFSLESSIAYASFFLKRLSILLRCLWSAMVCPRQCKLLGKVNRGESKQTAPSALEGFALMCPNRNGSPLQDSFLENPTVRGAWRATVRGVTRSQTRLSTQVLPALRTQSFYQVPGPTPCSPLRACLFLPETGC